MLSDIQIPEYVQKTTSKLAGENLLFLNDFLT